MLPPLSKPVLVNLTSVVVVPGVVGALIVIPPLLTVVPPTVKEPVLLKSTSLFKLYLTTPSLSISAVVFVPFVKSKPFSNVTVLAPLPLALYVKGITLAALAPSNFTSYVVLWLVSSFTVLTVIGLFVSAVYVPPVVVPPLFTVTASRAASLTALRDTDTSYLAPTSPVALPSATETSAMFVSPVTAFLTTLSVEAAVAVAGST